MVSPRLPRIDIFINKLEQLLIFSECIKIVKTEHREFFNYRQYFDENDNKNLIGKMRPVRGFSDRHVISQIEEQIFMDLIDFAMNVIDLAFGPIEQRWSADSQMIADDITEAKRLIRHESHQPPNLMIISPTVRLHINKVFNQHVQQIRGVSVVSNENFKSDNNALIMAPQAGLLLINEEPIAGPGDTTSYDIGFVVIRPKNLLVIQNIYG